MRKKPVIATIVVLALCCLAWIQFGDGVMVPADRGYAIGTQSVLSMEAGVMVLGAEPSLDMRVGSGEVITIDIGGAKQALFEHQADWSAVTFAGQVWAESILTRPSPSVISDTVINHHLSTVRADGTDSPTIYLPEALEWPGRRITVVQISPGHVVVAPLSPGETINGGSKAIELSSEWSSVTVEAWSEGPFHPSGWMVVGRSP